MPKCNGFIICYESHQTNTVHKGTEFKVSRLYDVRAVMGNRFCNQKNSEEVQWNGIVIFFNGDNDISFNLLEVTTTRTTTMSTTTTTTTTTDTTTPPPIEPIRPNCRHYTQGALYFDKYSCHCGSTNETDVKINK
uniref:Uncharacterized protein n=1 Tax=Meloidogyne incognita TaxID=6306 RepID=A0A914KKA1_MELIC